MRGLYVVTLLVIVAVVLGGCSLWEENVNDSIALKATGDIVTQEPALDGFDRVEAHHAFDLTITQGDEYEVAVQIDKAVEEYLVVKTDGTSLIVTLENGNNYSLSGNITMKAEIVLPSLVGVELSGASNAHLIGIESEDAFKAKLSGASRLSGELVAGDVEMEISGASRVALAGQARDLDLNFSGASRASLRDLEVENATVKASGSSSVEVTVSGTLDADASGASDIMYGEGTTLGTIDTSGSSNVTMR